MRASDVNRDFASALENHTTSVNRSAFLPIPELFRLDGDVHVIFLSGNGIEFLEQTEDAWYRGTVPGSEISYNIREGTSKTYWPEEAASPLGCVRKFQFCNTALPSDKQCGPLAAWHDAIFESAPLFNMTGQQALKPEHGPTGSPASRFFWIMEELLNVATELDPIVQTLGPESLSSKANLIQGFMGRLPPNQWQLDVTHWWSTYLASVQAAFVQTAMGPADPTGELEQIKFGPWNDHVRSLCSNQVCKTLQGIPSSLCMDLTCVILSLPATVTRSHCAVGFFLSGDKRLGS